MFKTSGFLWGRGRGSPADEDGRCAGISVAVDGGHRDGIGGICQIGAQRAGNGERIPVFSVARLDCVVRGAGCLSPADGGCLAFRGSGDG